MSDRAPVDRVRTTVLLLFPWLAQIKVASNVLRIRSADQRIELQGPGAAPVLRTPDVARFKFDPGIPSTGPGPALFLTLDGGTTWTVVDMLTPGSTGGGTVPPIGGGATATAITSAGSVRVSCG